MSFLGDLKDLSIYEILQLLSNGRHTGFLTLTHNREKARILFNRGRIVYASSYPDSRLGNTLVRKGLLSITDLKSILREQRQMTDKQPFGSIILQKELLSEEILESEIKNQVMEVIKKFSSWNSGLFYFNGGENSHASLLLNHGLSVDYLLLENSRIYDEEMSSLPASTALLPSHED